MGILNKVQNNKVKMVETGEKKTKHKALEEKLIKPKEGRVLHVKNRPDHTAIQYMHSANHSQRDLNFFFKMSSNQTFGSQAVLEFAQLAAAHCSLVESPSWKLIVFYTSQHTVGKALSGY